MLVISSDHSQFRIRLDDFIHSLAPEQRSRLTNDSDLQKALAKVRATNLDPLNEIISPLYSASGRLAKQQIEIFRSLLLMIHFRITSIDIWHQKLIADSLIAGLCGFSSEIPSVGSFYNFITRLYNQDETPRVQSIGFNKKPKDKVKKGQKWENGTKSVVSSLIEEMSKEGYVFADSTLLQILKCVAVLPSAEKDLINLKEVILSGDGTAIHEHASARGSSIHGDENNRRYSDPEANIGWDSDLGSYFFGYHGYFSCIHNPEYSVDLPVLMQLNKASVHDAGPGVASLFGFQKLYPQANIKAVCFDSANDNEATYQYIESIGARPYIDPNLRAKDKGNHPKEYLDTKGNMICSAGIAMHNAGWDKTNKCIRFQCPCKVKKTGVSECPLGKPCSNRARGRIIAYRPDSLRTKYIAMRFQKQWAEVYKNRTSCERVNNRILNDYQLHQTKQRGRKHLLMHILLGFINIHADAWIKIGKAD